MNILKQKWNVIKKKEINENVEKKWNVIKKKKEMKNSKKNEM